VDEVRELGDLQVARLVLVEKSEDKVEERDPVVGAEVEDRREELHEVQGHLRGRRVVHDGHRAAVELGVDDAVVIEELHRGDGPRPVDVDVFVLLLDPEHRARLDVAHQHHVPQLDEPIGFCCGSKFFSLP